MGVITKIRQRLQSQINNIYASKHGVFSRAEIVAEIKGLLSDEVIDVDDIAEAIFDADDKNRTLPTPPQIELFTEEDGDNVVIKLDGGQRVKYADATMAHLRYQESSMIRNLTNATLALQAERDRIDFVASLLSADPNMTYRQAMKALGRW